ncbi:uncharacterized protein RBU33_022830 [Hipposideros larvatus]
MSTQRSPIIPSQSTLIFSFNICNVDLLFSSYCYSLLATSAQAEWAPPKGSRQGQGVAQRSAANSARVQGSQGDRQPEVTQPVGGRGAPVPIWVCSYSQLVPGCGPGRWLPRALTGGLGVPDSAMAADGSEPRAAGKAGISTGPHGGRTFRDSSGQLCHLNECQLVAPLFPVRGRQQRAASWSPHARPPFPARPGSLGSPPDPSASSHHPSEAARQAEPSSECAQAQTGGSAPPLLLAKCISASQLCDPGLGLGIC